MMLSGKNLESAISPPMGEAGHVRSLTAPISGYMDKDTTYSFSLRRLWIAFRLLNKCEGEDLKKNVSGKV